MFTTTDWAIVISSAVPALLWGVAFANIVRGVPLEKSPKGVVEYVGGFFNLLNPFSLLGGLVTLSVFATHGAIFLTLKTDGVIREQANSLVLKLGSIATLFAVVFLVWAASLTNFNGAVVGLAATAAVSWLIALNWHRVGRDGYAFLFSSITLAMTVATLFKALYPNVMPSSLDPSASLNIFNASSTPYTLKVMTIVAIVLTPVVLIYQGWTYWVFRKRISATQIANPEAGILDSVK